jgi:hypothetical protein
MLDSAQPASQLTRQLDAAIHHQASDSLLLMRTKDLQFTAQVDTVTELLDNPANPLNRRVSTGRIATRLTKHQPSLVRASPRPADSMMAGHANVNHFAAANLALITRNG